MKEDKKIQKFIEDDFDLEAFKRESAKKKVQTFRKKTKGTLDFISVIIIVLAFVIAFLAYNVLSYYFNLWQNRHIAQTAQEIHNNYGGNPDQDGSDGSAATPTPTPTPTPSPTPTPTPPIAMFSEFRTMMQEFNNEDIVGYLTIPDTEINYPVVQSADNEFYLEHDLFKKKM
ncbi:MAG: hypothetical protein LBS62_03125 [Clostridiales bacterium]|jgi:sortase B|nr:hypothetical protein [Clostridiales bacterium]